MAAPEALLNWGSYPEIQIVESTAAVLMDSISRQGKRDKEVFIGADTKGVERALYSNPVLEMDFSGYVAAWSGYAAEESGQDTTVGDCPGWPAAGSLHGFAGDSGAFVFEDPKSDGTREGKLTNISFKIVHYPRMGTTTPS